MARTKASVTGRTTPSRKVVVAKAPRKVTSTPLQTRSKLSTSSKRSSYAGVYHKRPTPTWQKGIETFVTRNSTFAHKEQMSPEKNSVERSKTDTAIEHAVTHSNIAESSASKNVL